MPHSKALLHNDTFLINRLLPDEILTMIFLLLGPSSLINPYVYLPLSCVCRRWRSIVFGTSNFWSVITHKCHSRGARDFTRDVILRSKSREVDVILCSQDCDDCPYITSYLLSLKRFQIRTLSLEDRSDFDFETKDLAQLENLIISKVPIYDDRNQQSFNKFLSAVNPRFIELPASLFHKQISQSLNRLEWLKLDVSRFTYSNDNVNMSIVYHVLETLHSLRILNLISGHDYFDYAHPAITLPNLRMFSLDPGKGGFRFIRTPALSYLGVLPYTSRVYNWDHFNGIDLLMVKSFRIALCHCQCEPFYWLPIACISTGHSEEDCEFFNNFHAPVSASNEAMDHHWTLPPTNSFHISFRWSEFDHRKLYSHLKRATNLVELIVDYRSMKGDDWRHSNGRKKYQNFLGEALNSFNTVTHLTVLRCRSFVSVCGLLMDGRRLPRLEQLSYDSSFNPTCGPGIVFTYMAKVQDARIEACTKPLNILELKNFLDIPEEEVENFEKLEIQLIQINPRVANLPMQ